jgi:hypothetical protein
VILYEDNRGAEKGFGLHALVMACVADDLGVEMFTLTKKLDARQRSTAIAASLTRPWRKRLGRTWPSVTGS